jgi:hypothetical protein
MVEAEMLQLLLTHGFDNISMDVRHCNRKSASQIITWTLTTTKFMLRK